MRRKLNSQTKLLLAEFQSETCTFQSVVKWKNTLKGGNYELHCLRELARYCLHFGLSADELVAERIEAMTSRDPRIRSKAEDRILGYHKVLAKEAPGTAICMYRRIKSFYKANYTPLQSVDPGYTIQREQDYLASKEETRNMCELLDLEGKAYLLTLAESCGRPGAVADIRWKDIREDLNSDKMPMRIWLAHKVKVARKKYFSFICEDAKDSLKLLTRGRNLKPDDKVFPTGYSGLRKKIMNAAEYIGIYTNGNGKQAFRLHTYRKRGQTALESASVPLNWVDRILGHVPRGAQGGVYSLPDVEVLRAEYSKAMFQLQIYNVPTRLIQNDVAQQQTLRQIVQEELQKLLQQMPQKAEEITKLLG